MLIVTAGIILEKNNRIPLNNNQNLSLVKMDAEKIDLKPQKKIKFKSNDEIRKEYGKLETVLLRNGRSYTGAVISTNEKYSIITVEGIINIPIKDIKVRKIIK